MQKLRCTRLEIHEIGYVEWLHKLSCSYGNFFRLYFSEWPSQKFSKLYFFFFFELRKCKCYSEWEVEVLFDLKFFGTQLENITHLLLEWFCSIWLNNLARSLKSSIESIACNFLIGERSDFPVFNTIITK